MVNSITQQTNEISGIITPYNNDIKDIKNLVSNTLGKQIYIKWVFLISFIIKHKIDMCSYTIYHLKRKL